MAGPLESRIGQSNLATGGSAGGRGISFLNETIDCSELDSWDAIGGETVRRHIHHVVESVRTCQEDARLLIARMTSLCSLSVWGGYALINYVTHY